MMWQTAGMSRQILKTQQGGRVASAHDLPTERDDTRRSQSNRTILRVERSEVDGWLNVHVVARVLHRHVLTLDYVCMDV